MRSQDVGPVQPWWRIGMVWVAFGGPAVVVLASVVTIGLAVQGRDEPLQDVGAAPSAATTPAVQARNHAATPAR